jgi:hypothetical protein
MLQLKGKSLLRLLILLSVGVCDVAAMEGQNEDNCERLAKTYNQAIEDLNRTGKTLADLNYLGYLLGVKKTNRDISPNRIEREPLNQAQRTSSIESLNASLRSIQRMQEQTVQAKLELNGIITDWYRRTNCR